MYGLQQESAASWHTLRNPTVTSDTCVPWRAPQSVAQPASDGTSVSCDPRFTCATGDSRALLLHSDGTFTRLSRDHKPNVASEATRILSAGGYVDYTDTFRVNGVISLSRAFGDRVGCCTRTSICLRACRAIQTGLSVVDGQTRGTCRRQPSLLSTVEPALSALFPAFGTFTQLQAA